MVLCAGFGTRLRPLTDIIPKPLLPVGDRPAVLHIVDQIVRAGIGPIVMNTHHRAERFEGALPSSVRVSHEPTILGTAGGVAHASPMLGGGDVLVWNGDVIAEPDLCAIVEHHRLHANRCVATLLAVRRAVGLGTLGLDDTGCVMRLRGELFGVEQSGADFIGIQILSPRARCRLPAQGCLVGDVYLPSLRDGDKLSVCLHDGAWDDIGTPRALLAANTRWLDRNRRASFCAVNLPREIELDRSVVCEGASLTGVGLVTECLLLPGSTLEAPASRLIAMPGRRAMTVE
jgi:mannose-1-phosphate guanylyltransferase